ncbi:hypothetical protein ACH46N_23290 [Streptomyces pristinaespiralis]|uniref:Integral membrane protein n=2 Tax=Streptomyces pristinaespiralis TaxID=38300 RepID=B5H5M1_STRE2|nr:hypothetical protein [Streptomyces pristinaespiralis]ALC22288.1 membrane protein [Streptomyces pristinaespiralis]EDY62132.1 integral membrane protein [Streptomyces pristinaespiralis ATCC 25486]QMU15087.1 hypothetical protein H3L99_16980 [Streptomyces pristinaespiralis]
MSLGDDHGYGGEPGRTSDGFGGSGQTRTRLPGSADADIYGGARRTGRSSSRSLITVVGVVVLLIAAIAFANQGGGADTPPEAVDKAPKAQPTAPSGVRPVKGNAGGIPTGYARDEQGAQSAASNYAVALGSVEMFKPNSRHQIMDTVYTPEAAARLKGPQDVAYSGQFLERLGLDAQGDPPQGHTFISRTIPVGTKVEKFEGESARVAVWYTGLIGMSGPDSTDPVSTTWKTWIFDLRWTGNDWKVSADTQHDGPAPLPGDIAASSSDEISKAVAEFGGFTYAR